MLVHRLAETVNPSQINQFFTALFDWFKGFVPHLIGAVLVLVIGWWLSSLLTKMAVRAMRRGKMDEGIVSFTSSVSRIILRVIVLISTAAELGLDTTSIITALGTAGVAVALALKDSLANVASGMLIIITHPFHVGDYLEFEDLEGTVTRIEMMFSTLNTIDNKEIVIPNSRLTANNIVNYTAQDKRRLDLEYSVSYEDDLLQVKALLSKMVAENSKVIQEPEPLIAVGEHKDSSVAMVIKVWCKSEDYWPLYYEMQEKVKLAFDREGIHIPYPQMDLHLKSSEDK